MTTYTHSEIIAKLHSNQTVEIECDNETTTITPSYWDTLSNGKQVLVGVDLHNQGNIRMMWLPTFEINWLPPRIMEQTDFDAQADYADHMDTFSN